MRFEVTVCSTRGWKSSFSSMVITGSSPPWGVRFFPLKSQGVEALILLGPDETLSGPCFTGVLSLSFFLSVTIWVTSLGSVLRSANFANFCFTPIFTGSPNGTLRFRPHTARRRGRIAQVTIPRSLHGATLLFNGQVLVDRKSVV